MSTVAAHISIDNECSLQKVFYYDMYHNSLYFDAKKFVIKNFHVKIFSYDLRKTSLLE